MSAIEQKELSLDVDSDLEAVNNNLAKLVCLIYFHK